MEIDKQRTVRTANFIILIVSLTAMATGLALLTLVTTRAAGRIGDTETQKLLMRLAWVALALLCLTLVLLLWAVMRFVRSRIRFSRQRTHTPYVDAWALAGKRFKLPEEQPEGNDDHEQDDEEKSDFR